MQSYRKDVNGYKICYTLNLNKL